MDLMTSLRDILFLKRLTFPKKRTLKQKPEIFLLKLGVSYLLLSLGHQALLHFGFFQEFNQLTWLVTQGAASIHNILGNPTGVFPLWEGFQLAVDGRCIAYVGYPCSGWGVNMVFVSLMVATLNKGNWKTWLLKTCIGLISIVAINITRVYLLSKIYQWKPELVDFNHKFTFTILVYGFVCWYFYRWVKEN